MGRRHLPCVQRQAGQPRSRGSGTANLWLLDLAARTYTNLTSNQGGNFRPAWSPDGAWIAFSSDREGTTGVNPGRWELLQSTGIYVTRTDGTGLRRVTRPGGVAGSPAWSPDGKSVLFYETDEVGAYLAKSARSRTELVSVDVSSGTRTLYTASNQTKLSPTFLSGGRHGFPTWSPDGTQIVYKRGRHLVRRTLADRNVVPLTDGAHYDNFPKWQPHGDRILFTSDRDCQFDLYSMRADGTDVRRLTNADGSSAHASWSPDGQWVMFTSGRKGFKDEMALSEAVPQPYGELFVMRADGSDVRQLTDNKWEDAVAGWAPEKP